ncbi:MAG: AAA family ATPase [Oscillospiraceae bacterium]|nr:AAA family ATPase [Oscillospiraceae bacterium]
MQQIDLLEILRAIDPSACDYLEWVQVGMALHAEGYADSVWDDWSRMDAARYHKGECAKKWRTFGSTDTQVKAGTLVEIAKTHGWQPAHVVSRAMSWEDEISYELDSAVPGKVVAPLAVPDYNAVVASLAAEENWNPIDELITYLRTLFDSTDNVGYVTQSFNSDGRKLPTKGHCDRTAGELIDKLQGCAGDIGAVFGDYDPDEGAWIRFNPLDGKGVKNENVTAFNYALVESDEMSIEKQLEVLTQMELPISCLVHSGGKSIHAIVKVDAADAKEYRQRVDYLYEACTKHGFTVDKQNRNPSRLSRMPGVSRRGVPQKLLAVNIGLKDWNTWKQKHEAETDELPEPETLASVWDNLPPLSPPLIDGVLRQGHKMLIAGPSKAGKSFALIEMCIAIAEGVPWMGYSCSQGSVLYVNLELDRASCLHRFKDVYSAMRVKPNNLKNITIWNLRGRSVPLDVLAPILIRRALKKRYLAVIIDPIYKIITGDENSADQMSKFCNQFDKICTELGSAVVYCHHHSKGGQGQKRSMDRASGSGVFARDPDALLDIIELELTDALVKQEGNKAVCAAICGYLKAQVKNYVEEVGQDDELSQTAMTEHAKRLLDDEQYKECCRLLNAADRAVQGKTAWRINFTLREYARPQPTNVWFDYPVHRLDESGSLADLDSDGELPPYMKATEKRKENAKKNRDKNAENLKDAVTNSNYGEPPTIKQLSDYLGVSERTCRRRVDSHPTLTLDKTNGRVVSVITFNERYGHS